MAAMKKLSWVFPVEDFKLMKIETFTLSVIAIITFLTSFLMFDQSWGKSTVVTILFVCFYILTSFAVHKVRAPEEHYHLTSTHLEVHRKTKRKVKKEKVPLTQIKRHKLNRFFLGGYLITKKGKKHLLFFNTKKELEKFEAFVKKHTVKKKKRLAKKKKRR